jgi:hypothetical protein
MFNILKKSRRCFSSRQWIDGVHPIINVSPLFSKENLGRKEVLVDMKDALS